MHQKVNQLILSFIFINILTYLVIGLVFYIELHDRNLNFYMFDIGQGDSLFIRTPNHFNILIDGGPGNTVVYKLGKYLPFYDRTIDLMILSHAHADHVDGLVEVLKRYRVKYVLTTGIVYHSPQYQIWQELISTNTSVKIIDSPQRIYLDKDVYLNIIFPDQNFLDQTIKNANNASIVSQLVYGDATILLTGDFEEEESLVNNNLNLKSDILKVGHHGSDNANDLEFLKAVAPNYAIISSGAGNKFKHPHVLTINNLKNLGVTILRTDLLGDLHFVGDGINFIYQP